MAKIVPATARTPHRSESTIVSEKEQQKNVSSWAEFEKELQAIRNKLLKSGAKVRTGEFSLGSGDHTGEKRLSEYGLLRLLRTDFPAETGGRDLDRCGLGQDANIQ